MGACCSSVRRQSNTFPKSHEKTKNLAPKIELTLLFKKAKGHILTSESIFELATKAADGCADSLEKLKFLENKINVCDKNGCSALHHSAMEEDTKVLALLISMANIDVNLKDKFGNTPIYYSALYNKINNFQFLMQFGADYKQKNNSGSSALSILQIYNNEDIIEYLHYREEPVNYMKNRLTPQLLNSSPSIRKNFSWSSSGSSSFSVSTPP